MQGFAVAVASRTSREDRNLNKKVCFQERRAILGSRSERRVQEILSTARQVFAEKGYQRTTISEIAQRLGVSDATVFTYFGSKRELCIQVVKYWYDEMSEELEREVPLIVGARAQLHFILRKHLKTLIEEGTGLCALVLSEGRSADEDFASLIAEFKRRYVAPLMSVLATAQESGEIRREVPLRLFRDMVYGSMEHILWARVVTGHIPDVDATALMLTDLLWNSFIPPNQSLSALAQFRGEVADALRRLQQDGRGGVSGNTG